MQKIEQLRAICKSVLENISLRSLTTFKIGGTARFVAYPQDFTELTNLLDYLKRENMPYFILGAGSNVLACDEDYEGIIICTRKLNEIKKISPCRIKVGAGAMMSNIVRFCSELGLTGLEWAVNIPGTIGGAVVMNAGAFGGQISNVVESVTVFSESGTEVLGRAKLFFDYRHSVFTNSKNCVIMEVVLKLKKGSIDTINATITKNILARASTQNVGYASAGSVFRHSTGVVPAKLIEDCGLKGERVGDAMVSPVHSGYIVNLGHATAGQVLALIDKVREKVYTTYKKNLECEIVYLKGESNAEYQDDR